MSYHNPNFPTQRTTYKHVENGNNLTNLNYIEKQSDLLKSQKQEFIGHIPPYINPITNDSIILEFRYNVHLPQFNRNLLAQNDNSQGTGGGSGQKDKDQDKIISETFTGPNKEYDPYFDYLFKQGALNDNYKIRLYTRYINVDSRGRKTQTTLTKGENTLLNENPLTFTTTTLSSVLATTKINLLTIKIPGHNFKTNDRVTLTDVKTDPVSIKALYQYTGTDGTAKTGYSVIFENNRISVAIKCDYAISVLFNSMNNTYFLEDSPSTANMSFDPNFVVGDGIDFNVLRAYNTSDMFVDLDGFTGTSIGNIRTNFLNSRHRVYFTNPDSAGNQYINIPDGSGIVKKITGFYILLPEKFATTNNPPISDTSMTIDMNFQYIGGIPINALNADVPITNNNIYGYFPIYSTTTNTINIKLNKDTYYINPTPSDQPQLGQVPIPFGGENILISDVQEVNTGFANQNNYEIELPETISHVFMVKLVNTIFPNTGKNFRANVNNKLYWENLDDGQYTYSIQIPEGNYNATDLATLIETEMYAVVRNDVPANPPNPGGYTNRVLFTVNIDTNTNVTTFKSFKEATLREPIQRVIDADGNTPSTDPTLAVDAGNPPYTLEIRHPQHGLTTGDDVLFSGFITTLGIPDTILNTTHTIANVIDVDTYEVVIDNFNLTFVRIDTKGGFGAKVYVPNQFRLLFNEDDTMGEELGFRNVGDDIAITEYNTTITNKDAYQNEIVVTDPSTGISYVTNSSGQLVPLENNALNLKGDEYILMAVREFSESANSNIGENKNLTKYFAKINLSGQPGQILYDTFVCVPVLSYDTFTLGKLSINFYSPNGELYDFNGEEHSFVLEVNFFGPQPQQSGINSTNNIF
jgi:hypothetical protein